MTHQDIIDRADALNKEHSKAYADERARIQKERESLRGLCGGIGHLFGTPIYGAPTDGGMQCVCCGAWKPVEVSSS